MFFLFLFLIDLSKITANIISLPIGYYVSGNPMVEVSFYDEYISYVTGVNTFLPYSVIRINKYNLIEERFKKDVTLHLDKAFKASRYETKINFDKNIINSFNCYITREKNFHNVGLSLGYHSQDRSFSFIHLLYNNKTIEHLQFAFHNINEDCPLKNRHIYIGGVPNKEHLSFPYKGIIKIKENLPTWGFILDKIQYNKIEFNVNIPCIVSNRIKGLIISDDIYNIMVNSIFYKEIKEGICSNKTDKYNANYLQCEQSIMECKKKIILKINNIQIDFDTKDLFTKDDYHSLILSNNNNQPVHNFTGAILGINFLSKFNYSIFDYEKKQIELYTDRFFIIELSHTFKEHYLFFINCILSLITSIILIITKFNHA